MINLSEYSLQFMPGFGYMSRTVAISSTQDYNTPSNSLESLDDISEVDNDEATLSHSHSTCLSSTQYVVYSATFQVPTFYFTIHNSCAWAFTANSLRSENPFQMDHLFLYRIYSGRLYFADSLAKARKLHVSRLAYLH